MSSQEYTHIKIKTEVYEKVKAAAQAQRFDIQDFASDLLLMNLERSEVLKEIGPSFKYEIEGNRILITDTKNMRIYAVFRRDNQLYCDDDKATSCIHVQFASLTPELVRLWTRQG